MDINTRVNCYDELYDRAVGAVTPHNDSTRLMEENQRMREELARIRGGTGSAAAADQNRAISRREYYPASNMNREVSRRAASPAPDRAEEFGLDQSNSSAGKEADDYGNNKPRIVKGDNGKEELIGRIESLQKGPNGWIITLEHGQVWRQMISKHYDLREGQKVRIARAGAVK